MEKLDKKTKRPVPAWLLLVIIVLLFVGPTTPFFLGKGIPLEKQCLFQDSVTHFATLIINVHHIIWFFAVCIAIFVSWVLFVTVYDALMSPDLILTAKRKASSMSREKVYFMLSERARFRPIYYTLTEWFRHFGKYSDFSLFRWVNSSFKYYMRKIPSFARKYSYFKFNLTGSYKFNHHDIIEFLWLITPCTILVLIGIPSFSILQALKAEYNPVDYIKIIGNQWYWTYEVTNFCVRTWSPLYNSDFDGFFFNELDISKTQEALYRLGGFDLYAFDPLYNFYIQTYIRLLPYAYLFPKFVWHTDLTFRPSDKYFLCRSLPIMEWLPFQEQAVSFNKSVAREMYEWLNEAEWFSGSPFYLYYLTLASSWFFKWRIAFELYTATCLRFFDSEVFFREQYLFDSYMLPESALKFGDYRLLDVDYPLDIYVNRMYQCVVTSNDVLHSWAVPSFGVKMDAIPGRLNQFYLYVFESGLYYGQCSELCGVNHGFMPIVVRVNDRCL